jgi:hypothetical protein
MVAITSTNAATPSLQSVLHRSRVLQARTEADQAEARAQSLRSQADAAEVDAQKSQDNVRNLETQARNPILNTQGQSTGRLINLRA